MIKRISRVALGLVVVLIIAALIAYIGASTTLSKLNDEIRSTRGEQTINTQFGKLAYTSDGPADGRVLILVHGFSTPKFVWHQITPKLTAAGFRVVTFDHFGRGFSDRPDVDYNSDLYQFELSQIIEQLKLTAPVTLVGYSMGGANVVDFTASHPDLVEELILIAPAGYMGESGMSWLGKPFIGDWIATVFGRRYAVSSIASEVEAGNAPQEMLPLFEEQANFKGYTGSLLSTLRSYPMGNMGERYRTVGKTDIPVSAIWGTDDQVVPYCGLAEMADDVPQLHAITVDGGNHNITYAQADVVGRAILDILVGAGG
jgi:pimeloyl-ACP methyl ester carboxylesterase